MCQQRLGMTALSIPLGPSLVSLSTEGMRGHAPESQHVFDMFMSKCGMRWHAFLWREAGARLGS